MREFVNGTDQQFALLKESLNDHLCHVYKNCTLPACCSKSNGRIGFEKECDTYAIYIDKGITCSHSNMPDLFREWLVVGTIRFLDFTDVKVFLKSLKCLY